MLKFRTRRFSGRCARHKRYNPAIDGWGGVKGGCPRCQLLAEIWETSLRLNGLIRRFNPNHDDAIASARNGATEPDPRQMSLLDPM
ncbi:MAG TPA: hypothetical protein VM120_26285 [Bryobacteraceae bacterium]|nr:hypothetical protein [Bryobacteraceae bacterium]